MKIIKMALLSLLAILLVVACTCGKEPTECEEDRVAIQTALDAYHAANGIWPTVDGKPGMIDWNKLVPDFLWPAPFRTIKCKWQVNNDPLGEVCQSSDC